MSGRSKYLLLPLYILLHDLAICIASINNETSIVHSIPLRNHTIIPEEYKNLPVVGKCCAQDEILIKVGIRGSCVNLNTSIAAPTFLPLFHDFDENGYHYPGDTRNEFVTIVGNPCVDRYKLDPDENSEDKNYLLLNGSVYAPRHTPAMLQPGVDYCMELAEELEIRTFVCFPKGRKIIVADSQINLYACGLLISVPFFILTIVTYSITPELEDVFGKALCRYCGCLALAFTMLAIVQLWSMHLSEQACTSIAFVIQFSFIACFFWLNVICMEMWLLVRSHVAGNTCTRMQPETLFFWYSLWCWGPSVILILVSMIVDLSPVIPVTFVKQILDEENRCFESVNKTTPYFYVPIGLLLLGNVIIFVVTFCKLNQHRKYLDLERLTRNKESVQRDRKFLGQLKRTTFVCLTIFFLMTLNWTMELIFWFGNYNLLEWPSFDFVNILQGVFVFGMFVLRQPSRDYVWYRIHRLGGINCARTRSLKHGPISGSDNERQTIIP
ncbi:G-protein coupled receptor Mth2 [Anthophora plagiata]